MAKKRPSAAIKETADLPTDGTPRAKESKPNPTSAKGNRTSAKKPPAKKKR